MSSTISLTGVKWYLRGFAALVAAVLLASAPYGCSNGEAPKPKAATQTEAAPPAAPATPAPGEPAPQADDATAPSPSEAALNAAQEEFNKGLQASIRGDYESAIRAYERTIELDPNSSEAYNNMGFAYYDKGNLDKAIELQRKALKINPNLPNGYYGLAIALEKKGDEKGALENWKSFIKYAEPHSKWWLKAQERITTFEKGEEPAPASGAKGK